MTTKQNDTVALTDEQNDAVALTDEQNDTVALTDDHLDAVVGGAAYIRDPGVQGGVQQRLSNTGVVEESVPSAVTLVGSKSRARSR
jgi:hypothetical protein